MTLLKFMQKKLQDYEKAGDHIRAAKMRLIIREFEVMLLEENKEQQGEITKMATCRFWKDQPDGFHGYCQHPEAQPGDACILNTEDECVLREEKQ